MNYTNQEKIKKYIYYFFIALLFFYSIEIISQIIIYQIDEFKVKVWTYSDLPTHIHMSITGHERYSLLYIFFGMLYKIFPHQVSIAVCILIIIGITIYLAGRYLYKNTNLNNYSLCLILALFAYIEAAVYILPLSPNRHLGLYMSGVWHNSSLIALKLTCLIMFFLFKSIAEKINQKQKIPYSEFIIFSLAAMIGAWIKPNLVFVMYPTLAVMIIIWFFKDKTIFRQLIYLSLTIIPTLFILIMQTKIMFPDRAGEAIAIRPFMYMNTHYNIHHYTSILVFLSTVLQSFLFPLAALPLLWKHIKEMGNYTYVWIFAVVGLLEAVLIVELGWRQSHGNWIWGAYAAMFLLFLVSIEYLVKYSAKLWHEGYLKKIWLIICYILFVLQAIYGYDYMHRILSGNPYH